jgi:hypothetical protein
MDGGMTKRSIIERLTQWGSSFIDVGMGIKSDGGLLRGVLRVTTGTAAKHDHLDSRIDFSDQAPDDIYDENIQVVELNALNATLAVIKWKKLLGVYADDEHEHSTAYTIDGNDLANEDEG